MKLPDFVLRWLGRTAADKIGLQEGTMDGKPWYKSVQIWNYVVTGLIGIYISVQASGAVHLPAIPDWIITILAAAGIYRRKTSDNVPIV
jgi:hypothetical protein